MLPHLRHDERLRRTQRLWVVGIATLSLAGLAALTLRGRSEPQSAVSSAKSDPFPLPTVSSSPFRNTNPDARYVGSDACRACHESHEASFHRTGMGRSMAEVDLAREPPDGTFDHPLSKRRYQVQRRDEQLWHRELLLTDGADEILLCEFPLKYVVGSGRHSLTYLVEADGFLVESPVTWYASRQAWGMSPGYDRPEHSGFERAVGEGCLICHAGQAEAIGGSLHRMRVTEAVIGCERCHGPGSLHVERHRAVEAAGTSTPKAIDFTIVNPKHLSRELAEAICQQCHLRTSATVITRGRKPEDYRPGLPLQDFRQDYRLEATDAPMTVVGHVEQMHLSRCFQATDSLTCLTCHDPHNEPRAVERDQHYQSICLTCHQVETCKVDPRRREQDSPQNTCIHCHMPRSPTEIPHLAFTHHRIAVHDKPPTAETDPDAMHHGRGVLKPFLTPPPLSEIDTQRSLGLGYLEVANRQKNPALAAQYKQQALVILTDVRAAGLPDAILDVSLARLRFELKLDGVLPLANSALTAELPGQDRCDALFLVADAESARGRHANAVVALRELNSLRRHSLQWLLLADCERALNNPAAAVEALETAARINPRLWNVHRHLAEHHRQQGNRDRAAWHERRAIP